VIETIHEDREARGDLVGVDGLRYLHGRKDNWRGKNKISVYIDGRKDNWRGKNKQTGTWMFKGNFMGKCESLQEECGCARRSSLGP
jgi:hypothetical protein